MFALNSFGRMGAAARNAWSPLALWPLGAASPGMWIDPSTTTACYQDSAGTTPLSTVGTVLDSSNPIGLVLDRKGGLQLGPELVTNGDMSSATGWTLVSDTTISGGLMNIRTGGATQNIVSIGKWYKVTFNVVIRSGSFKVQVGTNAGAPAYYVATASGTYTAYLYCDTASTLFYAYRAVTGDMDVDNISVREIPGLHLSQSTSAARPVASARVNLLTKTEDFADAAWIKRGVTVASNSAVAPDGTLTADTISGIAGLTVGDLYQYTSSIENGLSSVKTIYLKQVTSTGVLQMEDPQSGSLLYTIDLALLEPGWNRIAPGHAAILTGTGVSIAASSRSGILMKRLSGPATLSVIAWGAQANLGSTALPYQRVGAASDYTATGFPLYAKFDGTDDALASATFSAGTLTSSMDCLIAVRRDSAAGVCIAMGQSTSYRIGMAESGAPTGAFLSVGSPTAWVDGTQLTGGTAVTRATLHTALTPGDWHIFEVRGLDLSALTVFGVSGFSSYFLNGAIGKILIFASGQDANRDKARAQMAAYFGVTLA